MANYLKSLSFVIRMEIVLLGTSSMVPTEERNHSAALIRYKDENILVDCGEGTQRQLRKAKISAMKLTKVLISHWHGDHVLGLPGLFMTLGAQKYDKTLEIYGPKGTKSYINEMFNVFVSRESIKFKVTEVDKGVFFENSDFKLEAEPLKHGIKTLGYSFIEKNRRRIRMDKLRKIGVMAGPKLKELQNGKDVTIEGNKIKAKNYTFVVKGKKVTFILDTLKCNEAIKLSKNSDLLFCEACYSHELVDKAVERKHMTAIQAAEIAKKSKSKKLILVHFSQRYKEVSHLEKEARKHFKNTIAGKDFMAFGV
jgi:ribonuclease Z